MARKVTPAQLRSMIRQQQSAQRQAVQKYNAAVAKVNRDNKRAIDAYNRDIRAHNSRVRANRVRLQREIDRLNRSSTTTRYTTVRSSSVTLHSAYCRVESEADSWGWTEREQHLVDLAEAEAANSARATNALLGAAETDDDAVEDTTITDELRQLSPDLDQRWQGALFALNPRNPDAARHFCTSSREVVVQMLDLNAPDAAVLAANPAALRTQQGQVTRRAKIDYLLARAGADREALADFVDTDVSDVLGLFATFNSATHGEAGKMDLPLLRSLKGRVEGAIRFLHAVTQAAS
ncbi:pPIWI-associating nuclease domain-containing protein [Kineococcus terrestris]|uniref:pPIWI-associating nuclease domain-containing protein n=1 Tax=Kineococcus terrestris TaxID=2044856 RepID=UPI0034DAF0BB